MDSEIYRAGLAMPAALNRPHELRPSLRGALCSGVTREEICEYLPQPGVYCSAPAAVDTFRVAREVPRQAETSGPRDAAPARREFP
jgi:4-carboxymuconolactone decarboxylase